MFEASTKYRRRPLMTVADVASFLQCAPDEDSLLVPTVTP